MNIYLMLYLFVFPIILLPFAIYRRRELTGYLTMQDCFFLAIISVLPPANLWLCFSSVLSTVKFFKNWHEPFWIKEDSKW